MGSLVVCDSLDHDRDALHLATTKLTFCGLDDELIVSKYAAGLRERRDRDPEDSCHFDTSDNSTRENDHRIAQDIPDIPDGCPVHMCLLRGYQRFCHSSIGGIDKRNRPEDVYCVGKRIDGLVECVLKKQEMQKESLEQPLTDIGNDWLIEAFGNSAEESIQDDGEEEVNLNLN